MREDHTLNRSNHREHYRLSRIAANGHLHSRFRSKSCGMMIEAHVLHINSTAIYKISIQTTSIINLKTFTKEVLGIVHLFRSAAPRKNMPKPKTPRCKICRKKFVNGSALKRHVKERSTREGR